MGLAGPRNKRKIGADPRNLTWSANAASSSVGHRLMTAQGWSEGQSLGSRGVAHHSAGGSVQDENAARLAAARVGVVFKDDTLGLGAKLKSKDVEGLRTGMDAFAGLLGRLNAKDQDEVAEVERKVEEKKLASYAMGRWGGMLFVPGGVLVGGEEFGTKKEAREKKAAEEQEAVAETSEERAKRKEEKSRRKEERRMRREAKAAKRSHTSSKATSDAEQEEDEEEDENTPRSVSRSNNKSRRRSRPAAPDEPMSSASEFEHRNQDNDTSSSSKLKKRKRSETSTPVLEESPAAAASPRPVVRSGRQLLRGRNIEAKRRAFQDAKGLDGIFMRAGA